MIDDIWHEADFVEVGVQGIRSRKKLNFPLQEKQHVETKTCMN